MDPSKLQQLSRRERQIMDLFFQKGKLTAQEVTDLLEDAPSYTTVRTLLRILEEKGHLQHSKSGRQYVYEAASPTENVRQHSLKHVLKTFFGGSITEAVATFLDQPDTDLSATELEELESLIQKAKDKGKP